MANPFCLEPALWMICSTGRLPSAALVLVL